MKQLVQKILFISLLVGCSGNVLQDVASYSEDDYYLIQAQQEINDMHYATAISIIETKVSGAAQQKAAFLQMVATAYAGQCGFNFADFVTGLSSASSGSPFYLFMTPFVGATVTPADCLTALNKMERIGPTLSRTANQNAFVAVMGMALMGTQTRVSSDKVPATGDGTVDQDLCAIPNAEIDNIIIGFGHMSKNFSYLSSAQLGSSSFTAIDSVIQKCTAIAGASCQITDASAITPPIRDTMHDLLNTQEYGLGAVVTGGNPAAISGACP